MALSKAQINVEQITAGQKSAVAGALNLVENRNPDNSGAVLELIETLSRRARHNRHLIGVSGPPGVGKSSMISRLIEKYRAEGKTVGVLSVDPSSGRSGGALLGDRIRIQYDPSDPGTFIRSMAAGRHLGGLAWHTRLNLTVFEAVFDIIILETVGVGQSETEIERVVDTVVVVIQPGSGDLLQFMKAGIMEIPDLLVVNKADQEEPAKKTFHELMHAAAFERFEHGWEMAVVMTSATENSGFDQLVQLLHQHRDFLEDNGVAEKRMKNLHRWVMISFKERYGTFGVDLLGGDEQVIMVLNQAEITNPLTGMRLLADLIDKKIGNNLTGATKE